MGAPAAASRPTAATGARPTRIQALRRRELIEAALAVIAEDGLSGLTLAKVAGRAGLTAAMVNFHFANKRKLLLETLRYIADEFEGRLGARLASTGDSASALLAFVEVHFEPQLLEPGRIAVWYAFSGEAQARAEYCDLYAEKERNHLVLVRRCFERLLADHSGTRDAEALAQALIGLLGTVWQTCLYETATFDAAQGRKLCHRYLRSVLPEVFTEARLAEAAARPSNEGEDT
jgi:TetR/AcrR family transcriptional repressor of bet genes